MKCNKCGGRFTVGPSDFPGFDLMACEGCGRALRLIIQGAHRPSGARPARKGDMNRALRAARRFKQRGIA